MKSSKITALILCFCLMVSMTACGSNNSTENKTNSNKAASGSAVTENKKTSRDVSDVDGPALKDLYAKYFMMGAAINGSDKSTAAIHHEGMANILKKHYNSTTLSNLMKPCYLLDEKACVKKGKKNANATDVSLNFDYCIPHSSSRNCMISAKKMELKCVVTRLSGIIRHRSGSLKRIMMQRRATSVKK